MVGGMVGEVAAGAVTKTPAASLLGDVMAAGPLHGSEGTRSWLGDAGRVFPHSEHAPVMP